MTPPPAEQAVTEGATLGATPDRLDVQRIGLRVAQVAIVVAIVVGVVSVLPGLDDVRARLVGAHPGWLAAALTFEVASCLSFVAAFRGVFCARLPWRLSYDIAMTEQAANVLLPSGGAGGLALGAWALRRGGMSADRVARRTVALFLITSSVNFAAAIVAGAALAAGAVPGTHTLALAVVPAGLALLSAAAVIALPRVLPGAAEPSAGRLRRGVHAASGAVGDGIGDAIALVRSRQPLVILGAVGYMAFDVLALAAAFNALGGGAPPVATFVLAYTIGQLGGLIPLPGGLGATDGGLVAVFALYGTTVAAATAAVLAYRVFQLGLPMLLGAISVRRLPAALSGPQARTPAAAGSVPAI